MHAIRFRFIVMTILFPLLASCGSETGETTIFDQTVGRHTIPDWGSSHGKRYVSSQGICQGCHGADLKGGQSGVSCDRCHQLPHPHPFPAHYAVTGLCSPCHGTSYEGGPSAPPCSSCHTALPPGFPPVRGECTSCHGTAVGPTGSRFPNRSGSHRIHLSHGGIGCDLCHQGGGSGASGHGTRTLAPVNFSPSVNGKKGGAAWSPTSRTCTNVSCHGGTTTPLWGSGRINTKAECTACHQSGTTETTGYHSGKHTKHLTDINLVCTDCHDTLKLFSTSLPNHFSNLTTARFELSPSATLRDALNYSAGSCTPGSTPPPGTFSINVCHGTKQW